MMVYARTTISMLCTCGLLVVLLSLGAALPGCNIVTPVSYLIDGTGKIDPEYDLRQVVTVVFVDDRKSAFPRTALRAIVAQTIAEKVVEEGALTAQKMVNARETIALARNLESSSSRVTIEKIGLEAGAEQVIYVELDGFALTTDGYTPRPTSVCRVKVLDLSTKARVYPGASNPNGRQVQTQIREVSPDSFTSFARRRKVEDELAYKTGLDVAKLFHAHERIDLGENLGVR